MLEITIPATEMWDEQTQSFIEIKEQTVRLEHSLVSISKWESKWCKAFLSKKDNKTNEETMDYIKCMMLTKNVNQETYLHMALHPQIIEQINSYIESPMTASHVSDLYNRSNGGGSGDTVTSELIYYWMIALNIPFECQKWHLNRLLALINVCNAKNTPPKKMSKRELMSKNSAINAARRKKFNTRG